MPKIILNIIIFFVCAAVGNAHEYTWNFSYLDWRYGSLADIITERPEFGGLLEQIHGLIDGGMFTDASRLLRWEISSYNLNTRDPFEFESLYVLLRIDAALDYHLRNMKRQGANKMYAMGYLLSRLWDDEYGLPYEMKRVQVSPELAKEHPYLNPSWLMMAGIVGSYGDTFYVFINIVGERTPRLGLVRGWFPEFPFSEEETEHLIIEYWNADGTTDRHVEILSTPLDLLYDHLVHDLFFLSDYSEDIRIFCDSGIRQLCQDAVDLISPGIPILDRIRDEREVFSNIIEVCVTFRKTRAEMFFDHYYGRE